MGPDDLKRAWREQEPMPIDARRLLDRVRRQDRQFAAMIFWRDLREVGASLLLVPLWIFLGVRNSLPWTWYLTVPVLLWMAGFLLADRWRRRSRAPGPEASLRERLEGSLGEVEHQVRLLRGVYRWALTPMAVAILAFFGEVSWRERSGGWWAVLLLAMASSLAVGVFAAVYGLSLHAVRSDLEPRRRELECLIQGLAEDVPGAG